MTDIDPIDDLTRKLNSAKSEGCKLSYARELIRARYERGDYAHVIHGWLTDELVDALARQEIAVENR